MAVGFVTGLDRPVDLKVSKDGSLYYLTRGAGADTGSISKVRFTGN